ncbi:MAG TPA: hypothetical protein VN836_13050 [Verrucomicrobiae bacterium]|nr:hypothetical protein [Verrucomicrobiae bacterium]
MNITKSIGLSLLLLTGTVPGARGEGFRTDINPALLYYQAILLAPDPISDTNRDYLSSKEGKEKKLPERFGRIVAGYDNQFLLVRRAAHATVPCDWGLDFNDGPNLFLPHLARLKAISQAAQLRAVWDLQHGRQNDACEDLVAAFVMSRNAANDSLLISALVQFAMEALDYGTIANHFYEFSPETLKQLVDGFDAAPPRHTMAAAIATETSAFYHWQVNKIHELQKAHPGDDAKVMAGFHDSGIVTAFDFVGYTNFWPRLVASSGTTSEGVLKLLDEEKQLFPRIARIMALPPPEYETQAKQFLAETHESHNPLFGVADLYFTGFVLGGGPNIQVRVREFRVQAQEEMVRAAVEYNLHGEAGLKSVKDPFGDGPFTFQRFVFKGVDRGFELKSAYAGTDAPFVMIFVEKQGPAFQVVDGKAMPQ